MSTMRDDYYWSAITGVTGLVYLFLLFPLLVVVIVSFDPTKFPTFPPSSISFEWYQAFFTSDQMLSALGHSFIVAIGTAILSGVVGLFTALGFVRRSFRWKNVFSTILFLPMMISPVIVGVALVAFLTKFGFQKSYLYIIAGQTTLALPYVFVTVRAQLYGFDRSVEEAAMTLGSNELETFFEVTLPLIMPGLMAGMLLAFVISFGEFTATQFWVQPDTVTVPIEIYTMVRTNLTPMVNAMGTILMVITLVIPLLLDVLLGKNYILKSSL